MPAMRILIVEDDDTTAAFVARGFEQAGFVVDRAADGPAGLALALSGSHDLAVVDLMLPGCDGLTVIAGLRKAGRTLPVIVLSARGTVEDRVRGLEGGADDYLVKPFAFTELLARVQALVRRAHAVAEPTTLTVGDLTLDLLRRSVTRAGQSIELQPREFALLEYLVRNAGRVVSKTMIVEHVWDFSFDPGTNVVEARICRLRDKVDRSFRGKLIHTVRGVGYVCELHDES